MGEFTFFEMFRSWIGHIAWKIFLWSECMTQEEYWITTENHYKDILKSEGNGH